jgi:DNA-binding IclR family transcriptional regulator
MRTISKALDILDLFVINREGLSFGEIIKESKLKRTTAYRIISYLVKRGFIKQRAKRGKYYPGVRALDIVGIINRDDENDKSVISYLLELSQSINESVFLKVWYGSDLLMGDAADYYNSLPAAKPKDWGTMPLHSTCLGKLILSSINNKDLTRYFHNVSLEKRTPNTVVDIKQLKTQLSTIRREGIAFEYEENTIGVNGVAAGIRNGEAMTIGSIYVLGSSLRLTNDKLKKVAPSIKACSQKISNTLSSAGSKDTIKKE